MRNRMRVWTVAEIPLASGSGAETHGGKGGGGIIVAFNGWKINWDAVKAMLGFKLAEVGKVVSENGLKGLISMREEPTVWIYRRR